MYFVRPRISKTCSLLLVLILTCSLTLTLPQSASASATAAAAKKKSQSKKKASARSRSSKSSKARVSKRGRGSSRNSRIARGRGRKGKWRGRAVNTTPTYSSSPIHKYLTDAWTNPAPKTVQTSPSTYNDQAAAPALHAEQPLTAPAVQPVKEATTPPQPPSGVVPTSPDGVIEEIVPLNPLVAAYAESLAARGISADNQGFILTTMDGEVLAEHNADRGFNPASVVKVATSLTAISKLGPDFRFRTTMYTDGALDPSTGTLKGSVYLIGSGDPAFFLENALLIVDNLNRNGIRSIEGDLYVLGPFFYNFSTSREASARALRAAITTDKWTPAMKTAYPRFLAMRSAVEKQNGKQKIYIPTGYQPDEPPYLKIAGKTITDSSISTSGLKPLAVHTSLPLVRVLKALNDFSNNWMAHVIGNMVGGPDAVARFLTTDVGLRDEEVRLATSSGLGSNAISPRSTIIILRKLTHYLKTKNLKIEELLPIAGIDAGTLQRRFTDQFRGSVVAKTGTLNRVSALAGVVFTRSKGPLLFVIYNQGSSPSTFRVAQDETLKKLITLFGGPAPVYYAPTTDVQVSDGKTPSMSSPK